MLKTQNKRQGNTYFFKCLLKIFISDRSSLGSGSYFSLDPDNQTLPSEIANICQHTQLIIVSTFLWALDTVACEGKVEKI